MLVFEEYAAIPAPGPPAFFEIVDRTMSTTIALASTDSTRIPRGLSPSWFDRLFATAELVTASESMLSSCASAAIPAFPYPRKDDRTIFSSRDPSATHVAEIPTALFRTVKPSRVTASDSASPSRKTPQMGPNR